jgi:ferredoxin-NADP reductase
MEHIETVGRDSTTMTVSVTEFSTDVEVTGIQEVAEGVIELRVRAQDGRPLPPWTAGAHVDLIIPGHSGPIRQYSLCGDPAERYEWRLGILRDDAGSGTSLYVHRQLGEGDIVRIRGPRNSFELVDAPVYRFIAGGIGITPILPMIRTAAAAGADWRLLYGGRRLGSMAFLDELSTYGDLVQIWPEDEKGLMDLPPFLGDADDAYDNDTMVYCCGPEPLLRAVEVQCDGWPRGSLQIERFTPKPVGAPARAESFEVYLATSDVTLTVEPDQSILEVIEGAGIGVLSSCAEGTCGTCETPVLEGEPDHRDSVLDDDERAANDCMMICVSRSRTARLVLEL